MLLTSNYLKYWARLPAYNGTTRLINHEPDQNKKRREEKELLEIKNLNDIMST